MNKERTPNQLAYLELLQAALFQKEPVIPDAVDWDCVFEIAKAQRTVALIEPFVPEEHKNLWLEISYQSMAHYMKVVYEQGELIRLFRENSVPMVILKGTAAAMYYPVPSRRTMGDIDFLVRKEEYSRAKQMMESAGYYLLKECPRHGLFFKDGIEFELHRSMSSPRYNSIDHLISGGIEKPESYNVQDDSFPGLPVYENGLVLLGHIMQHLKGSGVGFRQIIDWMMFVHTELNDEAWEKHFRVLAREAGLEKLAITITCMCKRWMGLPDRITWCQGADPKLTKAILERIFIDGNFGIERPESEKAKRYLLSSGRLWRLQQSGLRRWKFVREHRILHPFAWLIQLLWYIGREIDRVRSGKKVFRKEKAQMSIAEIWKRLE